MTKSVTDRVFDTAAHPKLFTKFGLFPTKNIQVTSGTRKQARSESIIAVNPQDRNNMIAASKKFSNPKTYRFSVGVRVTFDGGDTWKDANLPTLPEWPSMVGLGDADPLGGMTDPSAVFDDFGNAFLVGEPVGYFGGFLPPKDIQTIGMFVYKSTDGGRHWSAPTLLHDGDIDDDKSWIASDNNPASPFYGHVYIAWGAGGSPLRFRRSTDHGATWRNFGNQAPEVALADQVWNPEISVGLDGTVHIVWHHDGGTTIDYRRSTDGGETFEEQKSIVQKVHSLRGTVFPGLDITNNWPHFPPPATFRVITLATGCAFGFDPLRNGPTRFFGGPKNFVVAWSDFRDGAARIYYRTSSDAGASFEGPDEGQALLAGRQVDPSVHHFHPQIVSTGSGVIGCAYYEYRIGTRLIDVKLSASFDKGKTFSYTTTVTDNPWDPAIDAPNAHGDPEITFIGEYFGLDADENGFDVLWTDTRTGVQELFYDRVETERYDPPASLQGIIAQVLFGVIQGGDGVVIVNGHIAHVPPRGPEHDLAQAMVALAASNKMSGAAGRTLTKSVYASIAAIAKSAGKSVRE
jgi:hypothetical protein